LSGAQIVSELWGGERRNTDKRGSKQMEGENQRGKELRGLLRRDG